MKEIHSELKKPMYWDWPTNTRKVESRLLLKMCDSPLVTKPGRNRFPLSFRIVIP